MMAFPAQGFVLLAMAKCASTTIEAALAPHAAFVIDRPPSRKHLGCTGFHKRIEPGLEADGYPRESYELVSLFRDPISWLGSWWRYRARLDAHTTNSTRQLSFEAYARAYIDGDPTAPTPRGRPGQFLTIGGVIEVDRLFAVERPETWTAWFRAQLGQEMEFEARNVSQVPVTPELSASARAELLDYFAPEYAVAERLAASGEWAGARGTPLDVPRRPGKDRTAQKS